MTGGTDYIGIATLITASSSAVATFVQLWRSRLRDAKIAEVHELVNSQSEKLNAMVEQRGFEAGKRAERDSPSDDVVR